MDDLARLEPGHALDPRDVQEHAAPDDPVARLGDVVADRALAPDIGGIVPL